MRIFYFVGSDTTSPSETFIRKSIDDLRQLGMSITVISGEQKGNVDNIIYSGFSSTNWQLKLWKFFAFLNETPAGDAYEKWGFAIRQRTASRRLQKHMNSDADFYWFDYLNYACYAERALQKSKVPFAVAVHGFDASKELSSRSLRNAALALNASFYVSCSQHLKRRLQLIGIKRPIHVIPYDSVPAVEGKVRIEYDFIALGRLTMKKCPQAVLMAFEQVLIHNPDVRLIWVGSGELEEEMKRRFCHLVDSGNLYFTGALDHERALSILRASRVFVQHSVTSGSGDQEGMPNSIIEAMRNGIPVISTIHSGIPEIITHGENGFLTQEHDFDSFAEYMDLLLNDESLRNRMGLSAKASIDERIPMGSRVKAISTHIANELKANERA
jgi:colanic acid/amylovoran biosynthesis glycosyltransferase